MSLPARLLWFAAALLKRCPPSWSRWAPRPLIKVAYRQLQRHQLEGLPLIGH